MLVKGKGVFPLRVCVVVVVVGWGWGGVGGWGQGGWGLGVGGMRYEAICMGHHTYCHIDMEPCV